MPPLGRICRRRVVTLKVGILAGYFPSVSETFVTNIVTGLLDRGVDVRVYAMFGPPPARGGARATVSDAILARTIYPAGRGGSGSTVAALAGLIGTREGRQGAGRLLADVAARRLPLARRQIAGLAMLATADLPPIMHCQFGRLGRLLAALRRAGLADTRIVTHFRGRDISHEIAKRGPRAYRSLFEDGDYFLTNCEFFRRRLVEIGCPSDRLAVSGSPIDLTFFRRRPAEPPAPLPTRLVSVGRLVEKKGMVDAIRAAAVLRERGRDIRLDIAGGGPLADELARLIESLGLGDIITLHGAADSGRVRDLLDRAHVFVAASTTARNGDQDATVNTVKEALAVGVPVVATDHGGIPELVVDGETGLLAPERDPAALADAIDRSIASPERARAMAAAGRSLVVQRFDKETILDELVDLYRRLGVGL